MTEKSDHEMIREIWQAFFGIPSTSDRGFLGRFQTLEQDHYEFKRRVIIILAFAAGGGGLGVTISKLLGG